jgi:hypothetical protein
MFVLQNSYISYNITSGNNFEDILFGGCASRSVCNSDCSCTSASPERNGWKCYYSGNGRAASEDGGDGGGNGEERYDEGGT